MIVSFEYPADGSGTRRYAVDLAGDLWEDFLHYIADAKNAEAAGPGSFPAKNRAVRAAVWSLCSHMEGVVSGLHRQLRSDPEFRFEQKDDWDSPLCKQVEELRNDAKQRKGVPLPRLNLRLKLLRDILAHPGIAKKEKKERRRRRRRPQNPIREVLTLPGGQPEIRIAKTTFTEKDLYLLRTANIEAAARDIDCWLTQLCEVYNYRRFPDTKQALEDVLRKYGGPSTIHKL